MQGFYHSERHGFPVDIPLNQFWEDNLKLLKHVFFNDGHNWQVNSYQFIVHHISILQANPHSLGKSVHIS